MSKRIILLLLALAGFAAPAGEAVSALPRTLAGELTAEEILNGAYPWPASPVVAVTEDWGGFASNRLTRVPAPGVHPRLLFGPDDLPELRRRIHGTTTGKKLLENLRGRVAASILKPGQWENDVFEKLAADDTAGALTILNTNPKPNSPPGHYQPYILYALVLESFDALVADDTKRGRKVAAAVAGYARMIQPLVEERLREPLADDAWRVKVAGPTTGSWSSNQGLRDLVGYHNLGYAYDFAAPFMTDDQRADVRRVIVRVTAGRVWLGAHIPHHFRNWNWVAVGLGQPLLSLAIEGEVGYDPRVFKLGVELARDYLAYGISENGSSTEAVGYTQFGLVWANPFFVAAARRGENLLVQNHHRAMIDWYLHTMQPFAANEPEPGVSDAEQSQRALPHVWLSRGDGADEGPAIWTLAMWKHFYPDDPKVDFLWQTVLRAGGRDVLKQRMHLIEALVFAADPARDTKGKSVNYAAGRTLKLPTTFFDPARGSFIARDRWDADATVVQFECRPDSVGASHEHADRGAFTLSALGRCWAKDNFRSVETKFHSSILIDGAGQGYWPGPGRWLGLREEGSLVFAACDAKDAYDWFWPKQILAEDPATFERFKYPRWESYRTQAEEFRRAHADLPMTRDDRPAVVAHWKGFEQGDPRMWDEDGWPVKLPHNPVQRAFRSIVFSRGSTPWLLVVDDIQKDEQERLYEWLMQTGLDTEIAAVKGADIILCDASARDEHGVVRPRKGDRQLLVRILNQNEPKRARDYQSRPAVRLETFERKDTLQPEMKAGALSGARSFGLDKRLVIASRSVAPEFRILLFPHRAGDALPETRWNADRTELTIECPGEVVRLSLKPDPAGRARMESLLPRKQNQPLN